MPQPNFVPVMPSTSRNTHNSAVSPSTSTLCVLPLTLMVKAMTCSPFLRRRSAFGNVHDRFGKPCGRLCLMPPLIVRCIICPGLGSGVRRVIGIALECTSRHLRRLEGFFNVTATGRRLWPHWAQISSRTYLNTRTSPPTGAGPEFLIQIKFTILPPKFHTDKDGDNVFATFDDQTTYLMGGTGKYKGITGTVRYTE